MFQSCRGDVCYETNFKHVSKSFKKYLWNDVTLAESKQV